MYAQDKSVKVLFCLDSVYIYEFEWYFQWDVSLQASSTALSYGHPGQEGGAAALGSPEEFMCHPHLRGLHHQSVGATSSLTKFSFVSQKAWRNSRSGG